MNMSSDVRRARTRGRVVRGTLATDQCAMTYDDLAGVSSATLDPARIETAIEQGYRDGHAAGQAAGWAEGHAEGMREYAQTAAHLTAALHRLEAAAAAVAEREATVLRSAEDAIAAAAVRLAAVIIGRELESATNPGVDAIARALALAPAAGEVTVRLHPDDHRAVLAATDGTTVDDRVHLVADPTLARGDALAEWGDTILDARIEPALERARRALAGELS